MKLKSSSLIQLLFTSLLVICAGSTTTFVQTESLAEHLIKTQKQVLLVVRYKNESPNGSYRDISGCSRLCDWGVATSPEYTYALLSVQFDGLFDIIDQFPSHDVEVLGTYPRL